MKLLLPQDKMNHFFYGFMIYFVFSLFLNNLTSLIFLVVLGIGKEIRDYVTKKGTPEIMDFILTILSGCLLYFKEFLN